MSCVSFWYSGGGSGSELADRHRNADKTDADKQGFIRIDLCYSYLGERVDNPLPQDGILTYTYLPILFGHGTNCWVIACIEFPGWRGASGSE